MISNILPIRRRGTEFMPGDCVRLADGREGIVRRREFRHDRPEVQAYEVTLGNGRGNVWAAPISLSPWFAEGAA